MSHIHGDGLGFDPAKFDQALAGNTGSQPPSFHKPVSYGGWTSFEKFLGPKGFKKFQEILMNTVRQQIQQEEQKAKKAANNLKAAEKGEPTSPN